MDEKELQELIDKINDLEGDARNGAMDALNRILMGRMGGGGALPPGIKLPKPEKIEIDPDLEDPEDPEDSTDDLDDDKTKYDDPDHLLKPKKGEDSDDDSEDDGDSEDGDSEDDDSKDGDSEDGKDSDKDGDKSDKDGDGKDDTEEDDYIPDDIDTKPYEDPTEAEHKKAEDRRREVEYSKTKGLAEKALEKAKELEAEGKCTKEDVADLEKAVEELADKEKIKKMSEEEFNDFIAKQLDKIDKILEVNYSTDIQGRIKKFNKELDDTFNKMELDNEDASNNAADPEYKKLAARAAEKKRYSDLIKATHMDGDMETFKTDLLNAISDQIEDKLEEYSDETYAIPDRRHEEDDIVSPATRTDVRWLPSEVRPTVDIYFDQSGSWGTDEVKAGMDAIAKILKLEEEELLTVNIWYFSKILSQSQAAARSQGSEECWDLVIDNIMAEPKTNNVIIMTDHDIGHDYGYAGHHGCINGKGGTVDGCVWFLWKSRSATVPEAALKLKGKRGTFQYKVKV